MKKVLIILASVFVLTGCSKASRVNHNIREDANNFKITRKVVALNTRTNDPLFTVEGKISLDSTSCSMLIYQMMLHTPVFKQKPRKKTLMPMTFSSFQQKKLLKMGLLILNRVSR